MKSDYVFGNVLSVEIVDELENVFIFFQFP